MSDILPVQLTEVGEAAAHIESSPISSLHLWFDRQLMDLPHAVLVDCLSQWVFARSGETASGEREFYYQVVISAARDIAARNRQEVLEEVLSELQRVWGVQPQLLRWRMVTEPHSVFSVQVGLDQLRPAQQTELPRVLLAGDWTQTGWPATMESAIRSGYLAAEAVLQQLGRPVRIVAPDLPSGWLARCLGMA